MSIHDAYRDPYARKASASRSRRKFEVMKQTPEFKKWRERQLYIQQKKCAYCRISLEFEGIVTHIDHVTPLYYGGSNDYSNFVLSCRRCNLRKWVSNKYVVPAWIVGRRAEVERQERLRAVRRDQKRQAIEILDDQLWEWMRDWV